MKHDHTIHDKRFCITGKLSVYSRDQAEAAILQAGGKVAKSVGPSTDFLVVGARAGSKLEKARKLGISIIEEADLESFLKGALVEVSDVVEAGDEHVRDLVGEARSVLDGAPTSETWTSLLSLVDACSPDELAMLMDYLVPQIERWEMTPASRWTPGRTDHGASGSEASWRNATPEGELRVAPYTWLVEMLAGHDVLKHELVHAIHLQGMEANARVAGEIVTREYLTHLRWLDLGRTELSSVFWQHLRAAPNAPALERIRLVKPTEKGTRGVSGAHGLTGLRHVIVETPVSTKARAMSQLVRAELMQGVTTLTIQRSWVPSCMDAIAESESLLALETLVFEPTRHEQVVLAADAPLTRRVGRLAIACVLDPQTLAQAMAWWRLQHTEGPEVLDLSRVRLSGSVEDGRSALALALADSGLPSSTTRLDVGPWWSQELDDAMSMRGVEVSTA